MQEDAGQKEDTQRCYFDTLPHELARMILIDGLMERSPHSIIICSFVCKQWHELLSADISTDIRHQFDLIAAVAGDKIALEWGIENGCNWGRDLFNGCSIRTPGYLENVEG